MSGIEALIFDDNVIMCACKVIVFIFSLESFAYVVGLLTNVRNSMR